MPEMRYKSLAILTVSMFHVAGITGCHRMKGHVVTRPIQPEVTTEKAQTKTPAAERNIEPFATFVLDGKPYCFTGSNNYYLTYQSKTMVDDVLDKAVSLGMTVLRTWAFIDVGSFDDTVPHVDDQSEEKGTKNGVYFQYFDPESGDVRINEGPDGLQRLDYLLHACRQRGLKVILVLTNNWREMGGIDQYVAWYKAEHHHDFFTHEQIRNRFKRWIDALVHRVNTVDGVAFKEDPAIFAWELGNELRCKNTKEFDADDGWDETTIVTWATEMSGYIKTQDPNHLVGMGDEGFLGEAGGHWTRTAVDGVDHKALSRIPSIDFVTFHLYPDNWQVETAFGAGWIRDHLAVARAFKKPVIMEEYNTKVTRDENRTIVEGWERRKAALSEWHGIMREEGGSGTLIWMLAGKDDVEGVYPDYDGYHFWADQPTGDLMRAHSERFGREAAACMSVERLGNVAKSPFVSTIQLEGQ